MSPEGDSRDQQVEQVRALQVGVGVNGLRLRNPVEGLVSGILGLGFGFWGLGFEVQGAGFRVQGFG